jgi:hypothetical protein
MSCGVLGAHYKLFRLLSVDMAILTLGSIINNNRGTLISF